MLFSTANSIWLLVAANIACALKYIWERFFSLHGLPSTLPWAGAGHGALSRADVARRSLFGLKDIIQDGYYKVRVTIGMNACS